MKEKRKNFFASEELEFFIFVECILKLGGTCDIRSIYQKGRFCGAVVSYITADKSKKHKKNKVV